ncbi:uncharacterized protein [Populus alba]|uniref:uncharacterized protein n=1 Tax=Populus alba TaxID=43335 RepID=UPI00158BD5CB|nr:uncharacterized protein LOC118037484 [Populus alba]
MSSHDGSTPSSDPSTAQSSQPSISMSSGSRGRTDLAWGHCREAPELSVGCKKTKLVCLYCAKVFAGGGINRFKQHLLGAKGEVEQCRKCPPDVQHQMLLNLKGNVETKKRIREMQADFNPFNAQQREHEEMMIRQLEDNDDVVTAMGPGYKGPNLHAIRGYYLAKAVDEVKIYVESYREIWKKTGCTLMADGLTDQKRRTLINFLLFRQVLLYVGVENIVHMVIDNAANYVAAGRKFTGGKEILRPTPTRFATNFIALQSILAHKDQLRAMVTSREWVSSVYAKDIKGKKPSMGYLYDVIHHAKEEMMRRFQKKKPRVKPFIDIINNRWDGQFYRNLYAAAFWLNPRFQYDGNIMDKHMGTISALLDVLEKYAHGNLPLQSKITSEMKFFRNAEHDFGRVSAKTNRTLMPPDDCDDEVSKEHADDLLGVDEIGSIPSTFDPNFSFIETEEPNH